MAKREKFGQRIYNAYRALRGDPWPQVFEFANPPMAAERHDIQTMGVQVNVNKYEADIMDPADLLEFVTMRIRVNLAHALGDSNAVEIVRDDGAPWDKCIRYTGRLRVVMPEKKEGQP